MNYEEFHRKVANYERIRKRVLWFTLAVALASIFVYIAIAIIDPDMVGKGFTQIFGMVAIMLVFSTKLYSEIKSIRDAGLVCPKCKKDFSPFEIKTVIATHNCTHCGREVYEHKSNN